MRPATQADALACAAILNEWIDATPWMPRVHAPEDVVRHYRETVLPERRVRVVGDPVAGYSVLDPEGDWLTSLYVAAGARSRGLGRRLLADAKEGRARLRLWTFEANEAAHRFYEANGFAVTGRSDGDNEEALPDRLYEWSAP